MKMTYLEAINLAIQVMSKYLSDGYCNDENDEVDNAVEKLIKLQDRFEKKKKYRKTNNPLWCIERIQEKIEDYKISCKETPEEDVRRQLEIIIDDLETILYE